jgi:hypothetical protein
MEDLDAPQTGFADGGMIHEKQNSRHVLDFRAYLLLRLLLLARRRTHCSNLLLSENKLAARTHGAGDHLREQPWRVPWRVPAIDPH